MDNTTVEKTANATNGQSLVKRRPKLFAGVAVLGLIVAVAAVVGSHLSHRAPVKAAAPIPVVSVSQPLQRELHGRLQFLGQFSPVDQVELRAQVGGKLTHIGFSAWTPLIFQDLFKKGE